MNAIRILLVDDQPNIRRGLMMRLQLEPDLSVVGEAADGGAALQAVAELRPDVLVMDYEMPVMDGIETARTLTERGEPVSVVMLSIHDSAAVRERAAAAGVRAFVAKHEPGERLLAAIRAAAARAEEGQQ